MRIREILILILRVLIIAFIVLSFSLPVIRNRRLGEGTGSILIMMDRSLSMNRESVFEKAKDYACKIIGDLRLTGDVSLSFFPDEKERILNGASNDLISFVKRQKVLFAKPDISKELKRVQDYFKQKNILNKEIAVITDCQASTWKDENGFFLKSGFNGSVYVIPVKGPTENSAVTKIMVQESIISMNSMADVFITVRNFSKTPLKDIMIRMIVDDKPVMQKLVSLAGGEKRTLKFEIGNQTEGWHAGEINIDQDDFDFDNKRYFSFYIPVKGRVFVAGKSREDVLPIKLAIDPDKQTNRCEMFYSGRTGWADSLNLCSVLIFSNYPAFSAEESGKVYDFMKTGKGVLYIPGNDVDLRNLMSGDFWPGLNWVITGKEITNKLQGRYFKIGNVDSGHPLFSGVFKKRTETNVLSPVVFKRLKLNVRSGVNIISFTDRFPFLAESAAGRGKFLFCSTGLQSDWSDLTFTALFPVLINRSVSYLSVNRFSQGRNFYTGEYISKAIDDSQNLNKYSVINPAGEKSLLMVEQEQEKGILNIGREWQNGSYSILKDNAVFEIFTVNTDPAESDLSVIASEKFKNIFPEASVKTIDPNGNILKQIEDDRSGIPLWRYFLAAALIALFIEMYLSRIKKEYK